MVYEQMPGLYYEYCQWLYDNYTSRGVITNMTFEKWKKMREGELKTTNKDSERYDTRG